MASTSNSKSKSTPRRHSNGSKTKSKLKTAKARTADANPCDDQNGVLTCWGGQVTNVPFPVTGGPWLPIIALNPQTGLQEVQFGDLATILAGAGGPPQLLSTGCRKCGGDAEPEARDDTALHEPEAKDAPVEPDQL